mmetsp:Transcript_13822/g.32245  ORF Transcript_13822/g.32245 Transcript_13822/m.32245 type:complete len:503 (+) Transcript_13822:54-1562(+)
MDIEWVIYHLIHNDDEKFSSIFDLDIDLCRSDLDQWERLLVGLTRNQTVTSIELSRGYQSPIVTEDDLRRLFSALRHLPLLARVKLNGFTTFDLEQSEALFDKNDTIEEIWIENAQHHYDNDQENFDGNHEYEDHNMCKHFIEYLATMTQNSLRHLRIEIPEKLSHGADFASLLSESSKLESFVIETTSVLSPTSPQMFAGSSKEDNRRKKFGAAMTALQSNVTLKTLDMDFHITFADFENVATMLYHNKSLTDLRLRLEPSPEMIYCGSNGNQHAHGYHPLFVNSIKLFFEALKKNTNCALKKFSQYNIDNHELRLALFAHRDLPLSNTAIGRTYTETAEKLFDIGLDMLQYNLSLEYFSFFLLDHHTSNLTKKKQMFLTLNQRGRRLVQHRNIRETVPKSSIVDQLSKHTDDDIDGLFYYISTNPWICRLTEDSEKCPTLSNNQTDASNKSSGEKVKTEILNMGGGHVEKSIGAIFSIHFDNDTLVEDSKPKRQRADSIP